MNIFYKTTSNSYTISCLYSSFGNKIVVGKEGWFTLSGKCCVSKQMALCCTNGNDWVGSLSIVVVVVEIGFWVKLLAV